MSHIIIKRWQPSEDFSRYQLVKAVAETREADLKQLKAEGICLRFLPTL